MSERTLTASDLLRDDELLEAYDILPKPQAVPVTHAGMLAGHPGLMAAFNIGSTSGASGTTMPGGAVRTRRVSETAMLNAAAGRQMRPPALAPPSASPRFLGQSPLQQSMTVDPTSAESGTTDMSMETSGLPIVDTLAYGGMLGLPSVGQPLARSCPSGRGSSFTDMDNYFFDETQDQMLNLNLQAAVQQLTDSYNAQAASNGAAQYDGAAPLFRSTGFEVAPASGNDGDPTLGTMDDRSTNVQLDHDRDDTWMMAAAMAQATSKLKKEGAGNGANSMEMDNNQWLVTGDDADDGEALMNGMLLEWMNIFSCFRCCLHPFLNRPCAV